jgi:hypothetical protein
MYNTRKPGNSKDKTPPTTLMLTWSSPPAPGNMSCTAVSVFLTTYSFVSDLSLLPVLNYCPALILLYSTLQFEIMVVLGRLMQNCTPTNLDILVIWENCCYFKQT